MKAVIVEDEFVAARSLERLIAASGRNIDIVAVLQSVEERLANSPQRFSAANSPRFEKPQLFRGFLLIEVKKQGRGREEHQAGHVGCGHLN